MPRKPRPGPRRNRTDLPPVAAPGGPAQAPVSYTGGPYGSRKRNEEAQRVAPLPDRSTDTLVAAAERAQQAAGGRGGQPDLAAFVEAAQQVQPPPQGGLFAAPSSRPAEPVTAGLPVGPGPGPEALPAMPEGPDPSVVLWAQMLPVLEILASRPGSSPEVRQLYRRIRSQLPPDYYERTET